MDEKRACWGLFRRRSLPVPTPLGWLALICSVIALAILVLHCVYPFLAMNSPVSGGTLVVEGWSPDHVFEYVAAEVQHHHYDKVYVTGGPFDVGALLSGYPTHADRGAARLMEMGLGTNAVQAVPAPGQLQDRTYTAAAALRNCWERHGVKPNHVTLIIEGPYARRSRLLYAKALGKDVQVGVISLPVEDFDAKHWWRNSAGFRTVVDECVGYVYAVLFFRSHGE